MAVLVISGSQGTMVGRRKSVSESHGEPGRLGSATRADGCNSREAGPGEFNFGV